MTYAELTAMLQNWTENFAAEYTAELPRIVRQAEDLIYQSVQIPALRKNVTLTTSSLSRLLTAPADFLSLSSLALIDGTGQYRQLLPKDVTYIREVFPDTAAYGTPRFYALYDKATLLLGPTPSAAFAIETAYFYKPESIVTAGTSWLGDNCESVLFYGCLTEAYVYMKGDTDLQARYRAMFDEALGRLKVLGENRLKTDDYRVDRVRA